jgi:hypothetical protein
LTGEGSPTSSRLPRKSSRDEEVDESEVDDVAEDAEDEEGFGDDFDDFEEGQEGADDDFGDFDDGFQAAEAVPEETISLPVR